MLSGSGHYTFGDGSKAKCPDAMVTGPTTSATRITAKGPLVVFGIGLLPAGWNAIIGGSAAEMTDLVEDARAVLGTFAEDLLHILALINFYFSSGYAGHLPLLDAEASG